MSAPHRRPEGATDEMVAAAARLSEALEVVEEARGALYRFHRLTGKADGKLDDVVDLLRAAGREDLAELVRDRLIGRDVIPERWTFQVVEEYDDGYWSVFREVESRVRDELMGGVRHVGEAEMKRDRQS
ncbi:MAG TPA: hypothetical protein VF227_13010 [Actinomycetes bacterium]